MLLATVAAACGSTASTTATTSTATRPCTTAATARTVAYRTVPGVAPDLTSLDVYPVAGTCGAPVVVWVHGGGFQQGDKANQLADKVRLFNSAGYVLVSVNYRLTDPAAASPVQYPTHADDVAAALAWVQGNIARYGGDAGRLALLGHSAGAQLVATLAVDGRRLAAHGLSLDALSCAAPLDTEGFDVAAQVAGGGQSGAMYAAAFGTDPAVLRDASPLRHVASGNGIPPMLVAERGTPARKQTLATFVNALRGANVEVTVVDASSLTHAEVNQRIGQAGDTVMTPPVMAFLASCFAG